MATEADRTFRSRFAERFPSASEEHSEIMIHIAEAIFGESPPTEIAEELLDVAAARLSGKAWDSSSAEEELDALLPLDQRPDCLLDSNSFLREAFSKLSPVNRAPSGRPVVRGSVYCVQQVSGGRIKIGFSTDLVGRLNSLNGSGPEPLTLLAHARTYDFVERDIHAQLSAYREHCEWFADVPEVRDIVTNLAAVCAHHERARPLDLPFGSFEK